MSPKVCNPPCSLWAANLQSQIYVYYTYFLSTQAQILVGKPSFDKGLVDVNLGLLGFGV